MAEHVELVDTRTAAFNRTLNHTTNLEQRDPIGATQQLRWTPPNMPMVPEWDADQAIRYGYIANVIAFRCVQIIADTIAGLPFRAGPDLDNRSTWDKRAPLAQLLGPAPGGPAPKLPARKLWAWSVAQRLITGRWAWELELEQRTKGRIVNIWPLASSNLTAFPTTAGTEWFRLFSYGRRDDLKQLTPDQVFYVWDPSQSDFRQPESAMQASRYDLSIATMSDRYSLSFLKNGAVPAAVVVTPELPNKEARARFRNQWNSQYRGPDNAGRVAFHEVTTDGEGGGGKVADAIDVKVLGLSQKDAAFVEQHKESLGRVAIGLGVPWSKLDASGRTFDNAEAEDYSFWEHCLLPKIKTYEDEINMDLGPRIGSDAGWFDLSKVRALSPNRMQRGDLGVLLDRGALLIDEARDFVGFGPLPNGAGQKTATPPQTGLTIATPARTAELPTPAVPAALVAPQPTPVPVLPVARPVRVVTPHETRMTAADIEARRARIWHRTNETAVMLEQRWERSMRRLFTRQAEASLKRLNGKRGRQLERRDVVDPSTVFDRTFWLDQTEELTRDLLEAVGVVAAAKLSDRFGISFSMDTSRMREMIDARAHDLAGQVTDTTYSAIREQLVEGAMAGESIPELADRIQHVFIVASDARAATIARTEVISAYNGASAQFAADAPPDVVAGQEWIATRDGRTRPDHAEADGQIIDPAASFDVGGEQLLYPGDPNGDPGNTVNCRCTIALLTPDDMVLATQTEDDTGRTVPVSMARAILVMATGGQFDETRIRAAIREARAA